MAGCGKAQKRSGRPKFRLVRIEWLWMIIRPVGMALQDHAEVVVWSHEIEEGNDERGW